ncbi:ribonuclease HI family protein [bacterium]|nr:ribonuclease HI family protein [bacterium]
MKLIAYIDGSCFGNPGEAGFGIVLQNVNGKTIASLGRYIGQGTNNIAEYYGLLGAIELAAPFKATLIHVYSDSELLVKQMQGEYRIKCPHLVKLHGQILDALKKANLSLNIQHISRTKNKIADGLARKAILMKSDVKI